jgi:hypothetical protein
MSVRPIVIIQSKTAEDSQTTQYTCPVRSSVSIDKLSATNYSSDPATLSVSLVTSGGSAGNSNLFPKERTIAPGETYDFPMTTGHWLEAGDFISTIADTTSAIAIRASGRIFT